MGGNLRSNLCGKLRGSLPTLFARGGASSRWVGCLFRCQSTSGRWQPSIHQNKCIKTNASKQMHQNKCIKTNASKSCLTVDRVFSSGDSFFALSDFVHRPTSKRRIVTARKQPAAVKRECGNGSIVPFQSSNHRAFAGIDDANDIVATCLLYTSPSPRDQRGSRMPSSA